MRGITREADLKVPNPPVELYKESHEKSLDGVHGGISSCKH